MSAPLFYLPGVSKDEAAVGTPQRADLLENLGLADDLVNPGSHPSGVYADGPDGGMGIILAGYGNVNFGGYKKNDQEWVDCGKYWVGWDRESKPTPDDLKHDEMVPGIAVKLADGNVWQVPRARLAVTHSVLPSKAVLADGEWLPMEILAKYKPLEHIAASISDAIMNAASGEDEGERAVEIGNGIDLAIQTLVFNYRLNACLASALGLFTLSGISGSPEAVKVLHTLVGLDIIENMVAIGEIQKKTDESTGGESAGSDSDDGGTGST